MPKVALDELLNQLIDSAEDVVATRVDGEDPLQVITRQAVRPAGADIMNIVLPTNNGQDRSVKAATGPGSPGGSHRSASGPAGRRIGSSGRPATRCSTPLSRNAC